MRPLSNKEFGTLGEKLAAKYLKQHGYKILTKNYRCKIGEIDIIARDNGEIVFAEVKSRSSDPLVTGVYAVDRRKQEHILRTAAFYLGEHKCALQPRFDIIEVEIDRDTGKLVSINHIKSAFIQSRGYSRF